MENSRTLIFNHFYRLKHDQKRSYILSPDFDNKINENFIELNWISKIHPIYAMLFSFFSKPTELSEGIKQISSFFNISDIEAEKLILSFTNNDSMHTEYAGYANNFPKNIIIDSNNSFCNIVQYTPEQFIYTELDFEQDRLYIAPQGIVFMINNICMTDCAYCYADRTIKRKSLSIESIKKILYDAHNLGIASFAISGGEFFLYKEWKELLQELIYYQYKPSLISTKIPLSKKEIIDFKKFEIPIQISLDSLTPVTLIKMLKVQNSYTQKLKDTICLLEQNDIKFQIATVLTRYNDDIENIQNLYLFLKVFKNLIRWEIRVAFKSLYSKEDFDTLKSSKEAISKIAKWIDKIKQTTDLNILWSPDNNDKYYKSDKGSKTFAGSKCSANSSHMVLLPDGKVTICEQLYWNPRFIIGDLLTQSIQEVWSSSRALELAFPKKEHFSKKSACKECKIFDECFSYPNKCYADILKAYGDNNWDYPDPRCDKAPDFNNVLMHV